MPRMKKKEWKDPEETQKLLDETMEQIRELQAENERLVAAQADSEKQLRLVLAHGHPILADPQESGNGTAGMVTSTSSVDLSATETKSVPLQELLQHNQAALIIRRDEVGRLEAQLRQATRSEENLLAEGNYLHTALDLSRWVRNVRLGNTGSHWGAPMAAHDSFVVSKNDWKVPRKICGTWQQVDASIVEKRAAQPLIRDVQERCHKGLWNEESGVLATLSKLQDVLSRQDSDLTIILPLHLGLCLFSYLREATESNTTLIVKVAAWQVMFLLADRWPDTADLPFLKKAQEDIKYLCGRRSCSNLSQDFASRAEFGADTIICPKGGDGVIVVKKSELVWVPWHNIDSDLEDEAMKSFAKRAGKNWPPYR